LDYYQPEILQQVVQRTSRILNLAIDPASAMEVARRARGTPRIANNLLRWVRDYAQMRAGNLLSKEIVGKALNMLEIDDRGLDEMDKRLLDTIIDFYDGGPVGLNTIATAIGEEPDTIEEVYEPYLIMQGFLKRTPRGRQATPLAYSHLGKELKFNLMETVSWCAKYS